MNIKKGDSVKIISGDDRGKTAKVTAVYPLRGVIAAEGIHMKKKHVRPRRQGDRGELVTMALPFPASRAMIVCPLCGKAARIGYRRDGGRAVRVCKKCGGAI